MEKARSRQSFFEVISELLSLIIFFCGLAVIYGWIINIPFLKSIFPDMAATKVNAALCFILSGLALWLLQEKRSKSASGILIVRSLAVMVFLVGFLTLIEYLVGVDLGIDKLLMEGSALTPLKGIPHRMPLDSAINFVLIGIAIFSLQSGKKSSCFLSQSLALVETAVSIAVFLGYIYKGNQQYAFSTVISLNATLLFILAGVSIIFSRPQCGFMKTIASAGPGGAIFRTVYPVAIFIPMALGWLKLFAEREKIFTNEIGVSFVTTANLVFISIYFYIFSRRLNRSDLERKEIEREAKKASSFIHAINEIMPFGIQIVDKEGNILFLNRVLENKCGKNAVGKKCWEIYSDNLAQCLICPLRGGIRVGETRRIEVENVFEGRVFEVYHTGMIYDNQTVAMELFIDITERKNTEKRLLESLKIKTDFTNVVSHELRTPLSAIKEGVCLVTDDTADPLNARQKELLEIVKNNIDRLSRLINDILDFQRLDTGRMEFRPEENNINEVVRLAVQTVMPLAANKSLNIVLNLEENLPLITFDKDKIVQVLTNLLNNSLKFTGKGNIMVATSREQNTIKVSVRDTGPGVKAADLPKLFVEYGQIERMTGGTGLGLAISREIIEAHGGKIWAESELGEGFTVHFILPAR